MEKRWKKRTREGKLLWAMKKLHFPHSIWIPFSAYSSGRSSLGIISEPHVYEQKRAAAQLFNFSIFSSPGKAGWRNGWWNKNSKSERWRKKSDSRSSWNNTPTAKSPQRRIKEDVVFPLEFLLNFLPFPIQFPLFCSPLPEESDSSIHW